MKQTAYRLLLFSMLLFISPMLYVQVFMDADTTGDAYVRIVSNGYN
jgi:hypothetical protein